MASGPSPPTRSRRTRSRRYDWWIKEVVLAWWFTVGEPTGRVGVMFVLAVD
jgi:hypothetical protein